MATKTAKTTKCLRTKILESMVSVYGDTLRDGGTASKMTDAVYKRVQRHLKQLGIKRKI